MKYQGLIEKLNTDGKLTERLMDQETPEAAQAVLKEAGFDFSIAEIIELRDVFMKSAEQSGELSDEDLEGVAGGTVQGVLDSGVDNANNIIQNSLGGKKINLPPLQHIRAPRFRRPRRW